jgi:hypothetical protein
MIGNYHLKFEGQKIPWPLPNSGIDIGLHESEERIWQRFLIKVKEVSLADPILAEACYWIINFEKIKNKRNNSNSPI